MSSRKSLILLVIGVAAASQAQAGERAPAWQQPDFVMEEIVVTLPRSEQAWRGVVDEIVVTLSAEEQASLRAVAAVTNDEIELDAALACASPCGVEMP